MKARYPNRTRRQRMHECKSKQYYLKLFHKPVLATQLLFFSLPLESHGVGAPRAPRVPVIRFPAGERLLFMHFTSISAFLSISLSLSLSLTHTQLRKGAVDIVSGLTGSEDGLLALTLHSDLALPSLLRLLGDNSSEDESPMAAADALINLSQNPLICEKLVSLGAASCCVDIIYRQRPGGGLAISRRAVMLLVNITQVDSGVNALLQANT